MGKHELFSQPVMYKDENIEDLNQFGNPVSYITEFDRITEYLREIYSLTDNWNGYGAIAPKMVTINNIKTVIQNLENWQLKLLSHEDVVPSPYGTVTLYFEDSSSNELSVEFGKELIAIQGEIQGEEIVLDDIPMHEFDKAIEGINRLSK